MIDFDVIITKREMKTADKPGIMAAEVVRERHEKENDTRKQDILILLRNSAAAGKLLCFMDGCTTELSEKAFFKNLSGLKSHLHRPHSTGFQPVQEDDRHSKTRAISFFKSVHALELMKYLEHESSLTLVTLKT